VTPCCPSIIRHARTRVSLAAMHAAPETRYLTEVERGTRAVILGVILGLVLAVLGWRR